MKLRHGLTRFAAAAALASFAAAGAATAVRAQSFESLYVMAPANPGGGWDQTARSIQESMQASGVAGSVQVENVGGAGGTVGLAQFVDRKKGDGSALMVSGLVMVGAILTNQSPVTLDQVTPIARLTGEYEVIVVPGSSEIQSLDQLVEKLKADPGAVSWAGGSAGGTDHILVGLIAKAVGADPTKINYIPYSGGGEALAAILGGHVTAGVSGYGEFAGQIASGDLRALAISSAERVPGIDIATLREQGVEVDLANWRAVMAPPELDDAARAKLIDAVGEMVASESWQSTLKQKDWMDLYLAGDDFATYLTKQNADIDAVLRDIGLVQ
jgi:putative tricarboxylic transport membrane protein